MATRREIKALHESAVIDAAVRAHNDLLGKAYKIVARPEPPDAILEDGESRTWLEHTDAFYPGWARDLTSFAASDKSHEPIDGGIHVNMDEQFAEVFADVVMSKFRKGNYQGFVEEFGPGVLIVGLETPWLSDETIATINRHWVAIGNVDVRSVFSHVYIGYRCDGENRAVWWQRS